MNPLNVIHHVTCLQAIQERRHWTGRWSGQTPCELCGEWLASTGHHLIISRGAMSKAPYHIQKQIYGEKMNLVLLCLDCHVMRKEGLNRDRLIQELVYRRYGEARARAWAVEMSGALRFSISMPPGKETTSC